MSYSWKPLKDYTNEELLNSLEKNENLPLLELAGYCSEILRRFKNLEGFLKSEPHQ